MKKRSIVTCGIIGAVFALALVACASENVSDNSGNAISGENETDISIIAVDGSVLAQHQARGIDLGDITEVSVASCAESSCHGGSWEAVVAKTENMWEGVGQIGEANPHEAHGSAGFTCDNCHVFSASASINQCNQCHAFATPEGWVDKDPTTTQYGLITELPLY